MILDIYGTGWGSRPLPLLPSALRRLWGEERLPIWMADELRLSRAATYADLDGDVWEHTPSVSRRVLTVLSNMLRGRLADAAPLRFLEFDVWPESVSLKSAPLSTRSTNALGAAGLLDRPHDLVHMTLGNLMRISAIGSRSALEIACTAEALLQAYGEILSQQDHVSMAIPVADWANQLAAAANRPWVDLISERDPRFAALIPRGEGTIGERIEMYLSEPAAINSIVKGTELTNAIERIQQEVTHVEEQSLEESLLYLLKAGSKKRRNQLEALMPRFGWNGNPPQSLEGAAKLLGVTRERVRQIEERFLRSLPASIFLPKLDAAITTLENAAPLPVAQAERLLVEKGICRTPFSMESLVNTVRILDRETDLAIDDLRNKDRIVVASNSSVAARSVATVARKLAGMAGVASVFQVASVLNEGGQSLSPDEANKILASMSNVEFLNEDWFWVVDLPIRRNRLANVAKKILSVAFPQTISSIREGVRRAFLYRSKTQVRYESLTTPPSDVLAAFFRHSPEFRVDNDRVSLIQPLTYLSELGEVDRAFVDVLRSAATAVLDRRSIVEACVARGLNENSVSTFLTYSPIIEHLGTDVWKLRGVRVDPAAIEALREANASVTSERRLLNFGWRADGKLWIAARLPYNTSGVVLGIPSTIKRYLLDRKFTAIDRTSRSFCGDISINEAGSSFGYGAFFRFSGADPGDVLLAEFDLAKNQVELSLVDELILDAEVEI